MREWDGGLQPASPLPTPIRHSASVTMLLAAPDSAVITLHTAAEAAMMLTRDVRSARRAMGMPAVA